MVQTKKAKISNVKPELKQSDYLIYTKKVIWIEAFSLACIWIFFIIGLIFVFYLRNTISDVVMVVNFIIGGIIFFSFVPFFMNWRYYNALWKGWKDGKEIIYRELPKDAPQSLFGNREIWIKN